MIPLASQYNIGPRIGIDGEAEFRRQISRINGEYKSMASFTEAVSKSMEQQGRTQSLLQSKSAGLQQQIALQGRKWEALNDVLARVKAEFGEGSQEFLRISGAMLDVENTLGGLEKSLLETDEEIQRLTAGVDDLADGMEDLDSSTKAIDRLPGGFSDVSDASTVAENSISRFYDILKGHLTADAITAGVKALGEGLLELAQDSVKAAAEMKAAESQFEQTFGDLEADASRALDSISNDVGISTRRLREGYTSLYAFTKSVGGDSATALEISERAMKAAADSAAYYDRSVEDATETLQSFLKGNYENDAALGIAATETTRNAKANEMYAKSFKELSESQKVDVLLAMVEAGNAASGALGQARREADEWNNVTGELSSAWTQLKANTGTPIMEWMTPILAGINEQLNLLMQPRPIDELKKGLDDFRDSVEAAKDALEESNAETAAQAEMAERYVDRLRRIEAAGLDTAESQREYAATVELINELMPDLNLTINANTGRLEQNTWAIEQNIAALKKQAEQEAKQAYYADVYAAYVEGLEDRFDAEKSLIELQEKAIPITERYTAAEKAWAEAARDGSEASNAAYQEFLLARSDYRIVTNDINDLTASLETMNAELDETAAELEGSGIAMATASEGADAAADALSELEGAYITAKDAARESIDGQIGLFEELADKNEWSAQKILKNWEKQQKAFANYGDNLKKAMDLGLDETLIRQLSDGSQESMMILDALVNDTEISVDEINAAFGGLNESKDEVSGVMGEIATIMDESLDALRDAVEQSGVDIMSGLARGLRKGIPAATEAMDEADKAVQRTHNTRWEIHSPSRWMAGSVDYIVDGAINQIKQRMHDMERSMESLALSGQRGYQRQLEAADAYPELVAGAPGYSSSSTANHYNYSYGAPTIIINARQGDDLDSLANRVAERLTVFYNQEVPSFG